MNKATTHWEVDCFWTLQTHFWNRLAGSKTGPYYGPLFRNANEHPHCGDSHLRSGKADRKTVLFLSPSGGTLFGPIEIEQLTDSSYNPFPYIESNDRCFNSSTAKIGHVHVIRIQLYQLHCVVSVYYRLYIFPDDH